MTVDFAAYPRLPLAHLPTPLDPAPRLGAELGLVEEVEVEAKGEEGEVERRVLRHLPGKIGAVVADGSVEAVGRGEARSEESAPAGRTRRTGGGTYRKR